jgi:hypothetical protein
MFLAQRFLAQKTVAHMRSGIEDPKIVSFMKTRLH